MIKNIQLMRCLAVTMVVLAHSNWVIYGISPEITNLGGIGVDIFFIISGFIIPFVAFGGLYHEQSTPVVSSRLFFIRRITRIWPLYFICMTIMLILILFVSKFLSPDADLAYTFSSHKLSLSWFFETLTFTHWHRAPLLDLGWSLQYEFIFYSFFTAAIAIKCIKIDLIEIVFGLSILLSNILVNSHATSHLASYMPFLLVLSQPMMVEFLLGMVLYRFYSRGIVLPEKLSVLILICTLPIFICH